jgi:Beta-galactosidase
VRRLLATASALLALATSLAEAAKVNPLYVRCTKVAPRSFAVRGVGGYANLRNGNLATQLGAEINSPLLDFIYIQDVWLDVEPSNGVFTWANLDSQVAVATGAGKKVVIGVGGTGLATDTPSWAYTTGAAYLTTLDYKTSPRCGSTLQIFLPWDTTYQAMYTTLVNAVGAHYASNPAITANVMQGFNYETPEAGFPTANSNTMIQCPLGSPGYNGGNPISVPDLNAQWSGVGYTAALADSAWRFMVAANKGAWPAGTELIYQTLGAGGMPAIPDSTYVNYGLTDFIPACEAVAGLQCASQYNGLKVGFSAGSTAAVSIAAIAASAAAGYPAIFQAGNAISTNSTDYPGGARGLPACQMNSGSTTCDGYWVLRQMQRLVRSSGADAFEPVGGFDVVTWNANAGTSGAGPGPYTDPLWGAYRAGCIQ